VNKGETIGTKRNFFFFHNVLVNDGHCFSIVHTFMQLIPSFDGFGSRYNNIHMYLSVFFLFLEIYYFRVIGVMYSFPSVQILESRVNMYLVRYLFLFIQ